ANTDFESFRTYRWRQLFRFDSAPEEAKSFLAAIEEVAVPAAARLYERRRERLGLPTVRPWDLYVDPWGSSALRPYETIAGLETRTACVFRHVHPQVAAYFETMRAEKLLDLESRKNKVPGGYSLPLAVAGRPFIFMNAVGLHVDVTTLLHEGGHSFHTFESAGLPYVQQWLEAWV